MKVQFLNFKEKIANDFNFGLQVFLTEQIYWKNLSISGFSWYLLRPTLFLLANFFILYTFFENFEEILKASLVWCVFWYSCTISVQYVRKLRRFFCRISMTFLSFLFFILIDYMINLSWMSLIAFLIGSYNGVFFVLPTELLFSILFFLLIFPIILYIGMLSINALDFSNMFMFVPIALLFLSLHFEWGLYLTYILPPVFSPLIEKIETIHYITSVLLLIPIFVMTLFKSMKERKAIFANAIA